jgi:hypothetical protein
METIPHLQDNSVGTSSRPPGRSHVSQHAHNVSTSEISTSAFPTEEASTVSVATAVSSLPPNYTTLQVSHPLPR